LLPIFQTSIPAAIAWRTSCFMSAPFFPQSILVTSFGILPSSRFFLHSPDFFFPAPQFFFLSTIIFHETSQDLSAMFNTLLPAFAFRIGHILCNVLC
jgi:hypothetical protein